MPVYIDPRDGFPIWGNPSPQQPENILGRQLNLMIADLAVNQEFRGRADEINLKQIPRPIQARAEGQAAGDLLEAGKWGSTLYDQFMQPYMKGDGTP